jgi:hypothetical protein
MPGWRRLLRWGPYAFECLLAVVGDTSLLGSSSQDPDPRISADGSDPIGWVDVKGKGAGMPRAYPSTQPVAIFLDRATITPGLHEIVLPLQSMRLVEARPSRVRWTRRKDVDATWILEVTGPDALLTFRGPWLLLGQLATLGRWPEPS